MYTTLNAIREQKPPRKDWWETLLKHLGKTTPDDEPLSLLTILDSIGLYDTLWCFRAIDGFEKEKLLLGIGFAREVEHLMPTKSKKCLDVFERYANGLATEKKFDAARRAARAAARDAAHPAAWAADAAADNAAYAATCAAAAWSAVPADAYATAYSTIKAKQESQLRELLEKSCTQP